MTNNNPFGINEAPAEAIVRLNLAKSDNVEKFGGRIWHGERSDGRFAILGKAVNVSNVKFRGMEIKQSKIADAQIEVRLTPDDKDTLLQDLEELEGRVAEIHVVLVAEPTLGTLTLKDGTAAKSIIFYAQLMGCRPGTSALQSDEFASQDELDAFLEDASKSTRQSANDYRAQMLAARQGAPVKQGTESNVMA